MIDAVRRELSAGRTEAAARLLRRNWLRLVLESRTSELEELCIEFPDGHDPHILLIRACCRDLAGDQHGAAFLRGQGMRVAADDFVVCFTTLLLAPDNATKAATADRARDALAQCGPEDDYPSALFLLGWTEVRLRRNFADAITLLRSASDEARLQSREETFRLAQSNLAFALTQAGAFTEAERILDGLPTAPRQSDWDRFEGGLPQSNRGTIAFWRGDFPEAVRLLDSIVVEGSPGNDFEAQARLYLTLSLIALGRAERYPEAARLLQGVSAADKHGISWGTLRSVVGAWLAHAEGRDERALAIAAPALVRTGAAVAHALLGELYARLDEFDRARQALALAAAMPLPQYALVSTLVTSAVLSAASGRGRQAHEYLDRALELAAREGVLAPFLTSDPTVGDLLAAHAKRGSPHDPLLRAIFAQRDTLSRLVTGILTPREREVLAYLRTTMTAEEIATRMDIGYPTVKTHIRAIYHKLDVRTRRAAIQVADSR
ncbi:LuxR C-terminal-related transcriptional regulator [Microbacterium sp. cx-55]|uniref:LuxR C-terminal-related transcriptional regulator n=1 Tax=Microbacterium sp. cx-55 TaxID=2875948 RepID=UPI001CC19C4E|nr:LuxR C-terminal-related transcriptional regulator [Microbacterium sp. cx-55]MBZ4486814.1 LuxR C-terminal-related transcriptional regulator [Microbacterium sp. cx-55]UGB35744.1 LuxR C-terminal-related transcriptional regulator [Microbacterium sp. cx-55]